MKYDLIIVARSTTERLKAMTQNCIDTALADGADVNVVVVETSAFLHQYRNADKVLHYFDRFNYNRCLNHGLKYACGDIHILANNDLVFTQGWSQIGPLMQANDIDSACALDSKHKFESGDHIYLGYRIGLELAGWCIFVTRDCMNKIGALDESYEFWLSDNNYAEQLINAGMRHGLFCNIRVNHIGSTTLKTMPWSEQRRLTVKAINVKNAY